MRLEPGPAYLAFFVLVLFVMTTGATSGDTPLGGNGEVSHTLVGWPLALAVATVALAAYALRPRA